MSNNSLTDLSKFLEYTHTQAQDQTTQISLDHPFISHEMPDTSESKEHQATKLPESSISENLLNRANDLAKKTGEARDIVLSNLIKQNTAWMALQNFLYTDLLVKGSLLTFNFWLFNQREGNIQENNITDL